MLHFEVESLLFNSLKPFYIGGSIMYKLIPLFLFLLLPLQVFAFTKT